MMKWNWGTGIAVFYSLFVIVMITAVVKATQLGVPLVQEEYYQADIDYEKYRTTKINSSKLEVLPKVVMSPSSQQLVITFPESMELKFGEIHLYRPSRSDVDKKYPIELNSDGQQFLSTSELEGGRWRVKINWEDEKLPYFVEEEIFI